MQLESKYFLVKGRKNDKTKEKLRINIRLLLNKHKSPSLFISNFSNSKLAFHLEREQYKAAFLVFKSTSEANCEFYSEAFNNLYSNEMQPIDQTTFLDRTNEKNSYQLILAFRKKRKSF